MKLRKLQIEGLRGAGAALPVSLPESGLFIFGENGLGKTTIADAIEFLLSGEIPGYRREGCSLSAAIHLDAERAVVEAELRDSGQKLRRVLPGDQAGLLEEIIEGEGRTVEIPELPLLRHGTVRDFVSQTSGEKRKALLDLLGLLPLSSFRDTLKAAANDVKDARKAAERLHGDETAVLARLQEGDGLLAKAEELRQAAGLPTPIAGEQELAKLEPEVPAAQPNRLAPLNQLARALEALGEDPTEEWNALIADQSLRTTEALATLIGQGQTVLEDWEEDACPLCEVEQDLGVLGDSLAQRATALAEVRTAIDEQKEKLGNRITEIQAVQNALEAVLEVPPKNGWPRQEELRSVAEDLPEKSAALRAASDKLDSAPSTELSIDLQAAMADLREAADQAQASPQAAALHKLAELSGQFRRVGEKGAAAELACRREETIKALLDIADSEIKAAIEAALDDLAELVDRYFGTLTNDPVYSDIKLTYQAKRSGQVEFSVVFDGRESLSPPQRIMSESQLNALGLALFLGRAKREEQPWRTLVLDDVVNSFDAPHRQGLLRLLADEFSEWQVIVLSHDSTFRDIAQFQMGEIGWTFKEIVAWDPTGGPVLDEGDLLNRLEACLQRGQAASGLAGFARGALEQRLARAVAKLGYRVPYEPRARYSAAVFLDALRRGLEESDADQPALAVLERIGVSSYFATLGVHYRPELPDPTREELRQVVADLKDLDAALTCSQCRKPLWFRRPQSRECECGDLAA